MTSISFLPVLELRRSNLTIFLSHPNYFSQSPRAVPHISTSMAVKIAGEHDVSLATRGQAGKEYLRNNGKACSLRGFLTIFLSHRAQYRTISTSMAVTTAGEHDVSLATRGQAGREYLRNNGKACSLRGFAGLN
jgi:hypothetical protein